MLSDDFLYSLQDDKVCRLCAEVLLKSADKYNLNEFLSIWQQSVPEGMYMCTVCFSCSLHQEPLQSMIVY